MNSQNAQRPLIVDDATHEGKYVTTCSADSQTVVSSSSSPAVAFQEAKASGCKEPILIYVPTKEEKIFLF